MGPSFADWAHNLFHRPGLRREQVCDLRPSACILRVGSYERLTKLTIPSSFPEELPTIIVVVRSQRFSSVSLGSNMLTKDELTPHWIIHVAELHEPIWPYPHLPIWPKRTFLWSFALSDLKAQL